MMPSVRSVLLAALPVGLLLSGCGTATQERALSGAGIGAAAGAATAALSEADLLSAGLLGAAAGAAAGALTEPETVNLGEPIWE
jgi:osmotically inducible lipoprotein OsmB